MQATGARGANEFIELTLAQYLSELETQFSAGCLAYVGPLIAGADDRIRDGVEAIRQKNNKLVVVPETPVVSENQEGRLIPALGYLIRYEDLLDKANAGLLSAAELNILLNFDQGDLYRYTQARDLSISLLEEWLVKYKFKDWNKTATRGAAVTLRMKRRRAREIAQELNNVKNGIPTGLG